MSNNRIDPAPDGTTPGRSTGKAYALLTLSGILWGAQPLLIKIVLSEITPVTLTCLRYSLISLTLFAWLLWKKEARLLPSPRNFLLLCCMGVAGILVNNVAQFTGLRYSTVTNCTLIAAMTPALTSVLAVIFLHERLMVLQWIGLLISASGVVYLVTHGSLEILRHFSFNLGDLLFLSAQLGWAVYCLLSLRVMRELSALAVVAWAGAVGALLSVVYGLVTGELRCDPLSGIAVLNCVYIIWGGGVCAMVCWNLGLKVTGASRATVFLNLMPLMGVACGVIFLGEHFRVREIFGSLAILLGVCLITHSPQLRSGKAHFFKSR